MLISAILLFTAGCGPSNNGSQAGDPHTGTLGIDVSFFQLPDTLYHGSPFSIILELSNKGAFSPSRGAIAIWFDGYDEHIIGLPTGSAYSFSQDLPGKTVYNLAGSTAIETIRDNVAVTLPDYVEGFGTLRRCRRTGALSGRRNMVSTRSHIASIDISLANTVD